MSATIIDGKEVAARVRAEVARDVAEFRERTGGAPGLATILVGDDPASAVYVANKRKACAEAGIVDFHQHLPADASQDDVAAVIEDGNGNPEVSGILLQLPVPKGLNGKELTALIEADKDVDGLTHVSAGRLMQGAPGLRPCTPLGVIELLDSYSVALEGAEAVVVGRSDLVGKPVAFLLLERNATVTMCHSRTRDLAGVCARADVLVAAIGRAEMIGAEFVKPGAAVIDVGINRTDAGLKGDVQFDPVAAKGGPDHAGARRGRADDDRDAAPQHCHGREAAGRLAVAGRSRAPDVERRGVENQVRRLGLERLSRDDWTIIAVAGLLVLDLLVLPWFSFGATITVGSATLSIGGSASAVDAPDAWLGVLALMASAFLLADLATERLSPHTRLPTVAGDRITGRYALACTTAGLLVVKFVLHLGRFGELALGFWTALLLVAGLVVLTRRARIAASASPAASAAGHKAQKPAKTATEPSPEPGPTV